MDSDQRMIARQAEIITQHRKTLELLSTKIEQMEYKLAERSRESQAWLALQKQIATSDMLQSEWDRFLMVLRMAGEEDYLKVNFRERQDNSEPAETSQ